MFVASLVKIVLTRSNYLVFLIIIEIIILISFVLIKGNYTAFPESKTIYGLNDCWEA